MTGEEGSTRGKNSWKIPLFDLSIGEEEKEAVLRVLSSGWLTLGEETYAFEKEFARYVGTKYALFFSSGTTALHVAYIAAGIGKGKKVLVPSYTFISTVTPVIWCGGEIVFGEIEGEENLNLSSEEIEEHDVDFVVFVPIAGFMNGIDRVKRIADEKGVTLIEDCSHAHGSIYRGKRCGQFGKVGVYSLYSNKNITTGEGGMLVTDDEEVYRRAKLLRSHGMTRLAYERYRGSSEFYDVVEIGYNYRATEMQAALGRVQLRKLELYNKKRKDLVKYYRELLDGIDKVKVPFSNYEHSSNYIFSVLVPSDRRDSIVAGLAERGIQTSWHYRPVHTFKVIKNIIGEITLPVTEGVAFQEITLPLYPEMTTEMVKEVVSALKDLL